MDNPLLMSQQEGKYSTEINADDSDDITVQRGPDHEAYKGRSLYEDKSFYAYDFLTARSPMTVKDLPSLSDVKLNGRIEPEHIAELGMANAMEVGREISASVAGVTNDYTGREIRVSKNALIHGLDGDNVPRLRTNARLGSVGGSIVQNAIPINSINPERQTDGAYAMVALLRSGDRFIVATVHVDQYNNATSIDYDDVAHSLNGRIQKKKSKASGLPQGNPPQWGPQMSSTI